MDRRPTFSLIVPTRSRPIQLRRFLDSIAATASHPERIEIVLVVDEDDSSSLAIHDDRLALKLIVGSPGQTMGTLNAAGYAASQGDYIMLLNDDVVVHTQGWDAIALACFEKFPDRLVLIHVNDTLMKDYLCTFPLVSRTFCELAGGICPEEYIRYRIDDHIEDIFNLLAVLGERRTIYLPDVIFEHTNTVEHPQAGKVYQSDPAILARDAPLFHSLFPERKELALKLLASIQESQDPAIYAARKELLDGCHDSFALRTVGRQHIVRTMRWRRSREFSGRLGRLWTRAWKCLRSKGIRGFIRTLAKKILR